MIIAGVQVLYCAEVENVTAAHPSSGEAAVLGRPSRRWGEAPIAIASFGMAAQPGLALRQLEQLLSERFATCKHLRALEIVEALPRNRAGKVLKTELRARFGSAHIIDAGESSSTPTVSATAAKG